MVEIAIANRSGVDVDEAAAAAHARRVLDGEGVEEGELGVTFVMPDEMRGLKARHLGIDEATDVLSFPLDGLEAIPAELPRQLGDVVICPQVTGAAWPAALVHGVLHVLGYDHGVEMTAREEAYA